MSVAFRMARSGEYPRIRAFLDEFWAKDHIYVRSRELFDWTFQRPGFHAPGEYTFALGEDGGELIAVLGGIPFTFHCRGEHRPGVWIVNYSVRPDHRRGAAALRLLSMFRNPSYPVVIASGLNESTVAIYRVLKGQVMSEAPRHLLVLPEGVGRLAALVQRTNPEWEPSRATAVAAAFRGTSPPLDESGFGQEIPSTWDGCDWPTIAASTVGAVRDASYLKWRYQDHPLFEYRFLTKPAGARTGLLVWRLETIRQQTDQGRVDVDRIGRVVEFLPASPSNGGQLVGALVAALGREQAIGADFYGFHGPTRSMLDALGFASTASHPDGWAIPSRFQPLAQASPTLNAMFADPGLPACDARIDCPWYWTRSDSDQDRPN